MFATSADGQRVRYDVTGRGSTALLFVHGWLGNARWWDLQRPALAEACTLVQLDLAGHGGSDQQRAVWTVAAYAEDIAAVARAVPCERLVLVGHSMSGASVLVAAEGLARVAAVILVDTLKNLDQRPPAAQTAQILDLYRRDFAAAVRGVLPAFLFSPATPPAVIARLTGEFLAVDGARAAALLEGFYAHDPREVAARTRVPVREIGGDLHPNEVAVNRRYFADYASRALAGCGHYPMLERPDAFNAALRETLHELGLADG